jgi:hypothetical protein
MQKVFEKIIEKLEELKKAELEREDLCDEEGCGDGEEIYEDGKSAGRYEQTVRIMQIVKQAAAEYNKGWIPCNSGKLPEEYEDVEVSVEEIADDVGGKRYYTMRSWLQDGKWVIKKNPYHPTVIAWKYPTEPYQPKEE